ncbi:hypothetical protein KA005_24615, partial [bacterium]|nr:hypothetical protein [bacterium]
MKDKRIAILILFVYAFLGFVAFASAEEPARPRVDRIFDSKKEGKIQNLANLPLNKAFESLKDAEFFTNGDLMNKGIYEGFRGRKGKAIAFAMKYLKFSQSAGTDSARSMRGRDLYTAKKILQVFPDEAVDDLLELYATGGPETKRNILYAAGTMAGGPSIRN